MKALFFTHPSGCQFLTSVSQKKKSFHETESYGTFNRSD